LADSIPEGVSTDIPAGTERPEPTGATDDVEAEASSRSSSESDIEAAEKPEESPERRQKKLQKKALKKAKKEAKKEAKRLRKEQEALSQEALEGLRGMQLTSSKEQPEGALAAMETAALAQAAGDRKAALPLPGQVNVSGLKGKAAREEAYERELAKLQVELVKLQAWIKQKGLKVVVLFEGRDAAGKGGVIKRITERLNPRICRVCALGTASERERSQWYFQRYVAQLPGAGEMVLFDRSWYNRGGVERVMDFCSEEEYAEFMNSCPIFEDMLIRSGIILIKYWFSVSDDVQEKRFQGRIADSTKRWKLSPMDVESRNRWVEYSKAKDEMLKYTDTDSAPWIHVHADSKKLARLNCISHLLSTIPYQDLTPPPTILPPRKHCQDYVRPPMTAMKWVQNKYI
jgi:polyphosphate kinase 2